MSVKINGIDFGNKVFPNNERIFETGDWSNTTNVIVDFKFETDMDIWKLFVAKKTIDEFYSKNCCKILNMGYIPYSRMDRKINGFSFSLKYFCELINSLSFDSVIVLDPHSYVSEALIDNINHIDIQYYVNKVLKIESPDFIFYPDNGAMKRYGEILKFPEHVGIFYGSKKRDLKTGEIISFGLVNKPDNLKGNNVLIVDDLCSKGGTFMASASLIKEAGAKRVSLYVSHCEDSIYSGNILKTNVIDKVYTTHSILSDETSNKIEFVD